MLILAMVPAILVAVGHVSRRHVAGAVVVVATLAVAAVPTASPPLARAAALRACTHDDFANASSEARRGRDVVAATALGTWGTSACLLRLRASFGVVPASMRLKSGAFVRGIGGNPRSTSYNQVVRPGNVLVASWRWQNWCGAAGRYVIQADWGMPSDYTAPSQSVRGPSCGSARSKSTLVRVATPVRACSASDYKPTVSLGQPFQSALIAFVQIAPNSSRPCVLRHLRIRFAIQGKVGGKWKTLAPIDGNPASRTVGTMLTPRYGAAFVFWAWTNWCGGGDQFRAHASVNGTAVAGSISTQGATCEDSSMPSRLTPNFGHS